MTANDRNAPSAQGRPENGGALIGEKKPYPTAAGRQ